ncbi:hypothetical protein FRB90_012488 [Tulasnella sp. 427]|nr:hypothetical protein FRB90_012488 [Tulasnella sp. 427]
METMKEPQTIWVDGEERIVPDLSHHLSDLAKNRQPSPLKQLAKYLMKPGILSLAGGMPHPEYFPFDTLSAKVLANDSYDTKYTESNESSSTSGPLSWFWSLLGIGGDSKKRTEDLTVPKYRPEYSDNQLAVALQYGTAQGILPLQKFINEFARKVYKPYLPTTSITITTGNTDGWNRVVEALCNKGDGLLVEEWSYPSALHTSRPHGVFPVPVAMDLEGMRSDALETILESWDEAARGCRRPHIMYLVRVHLVNHPLYRSKLSPENPVTLEEKLFVTIAEKNLIIGPGWIFTTKLEEETPLDKTDFTGDSIVNGLLKPRQDVQDPSGDPADHDPAQYAHFRIAFSSASESDMKEGMKIFASVLRDFFGN